MMATDLTHEQRYSTIDKVTNCKRILVKVTAREPLICTVEKGIMFTVEDDVCNSLPLLLRRIDARGVMGTGMK
jgi:hypothetical protein